MSDLQLALIGLGAAFLFGLALWEWRRSRRAPGRTRLPESRAADITLTTERPRRIEPGLGEVVSVFAPQAEERLEVPSIVPGAPVPESLPVAADAAVDVPAAARGAGGEVILAPEPAAPPAPAPSRAPVEIRWPPRHTERVLTLRLVKSDGGALPGRALRIALEAAGLASGPQRIYHRADPEGTVIVSAANLVQPGTLDPAQMDAGEYRGIALFSVLPGPMPPVRMLEELVATARSVAHRLGAIVQDEKGAGLDGQRLAELRRSLEAAPDSIP